MAPLFLLTAPQVTLRALFDRPGEEMNLAWIKLFVAAAAIVALLYEASRESEGEPIALVRRKTVAGFLAFAAVICYFQFFNVGYRDFYHRWELFHYYVGAKYFRELGYDNLYRCAAVAEVDLGYQRDVRARKLRDLGRTNLVIDTTDALAHPEICKTAFSSERWDAFKRDVDFFKKEAGGGSWWHDMNKDHGYNPPPVWGVTGWLFSSLNPAEKWYMKLLSSLDLGLFAAAFGFIAWAFNWRVAALALIFWGSEGASPFFWTGGAFLRQDWFFYTVASACLIRKRKYFWGGAFMTYAALLRVFPMFFFSGWLVVAAAYAYRAYRAHTRGSNDGGDVEAKGYRDFKRSGKAAGGGLTLNALLHPQLKLVATGALAAGLVLIPASVAIAGPRAWPDFIAHIVVHNKTPLTNHMGWRTIVGHNAEGRMQYVRDNRMTDPFSKWKDMRRERVHTQSAFYYGGIALMGAFFVYACWRLKSLWVVQALGCLPAMLGSELTCYYYSFFVFAAMLSKGRRPLEIGLMLAAVLSQFCNLQYVFYDDRFTGMTVVFLNLALFMVAMYARRPKTQLAEVMTPAPVGGALSVPPAADLPPALPPIRLPLVAGLPSIAPPSRPMTYPRRRLAPAALALAAFASAPALSSCSKDDPEPEVFGMLLTPGQERDAWGRAPEPARVVLKALIDTSTEPVTLADQPWPFDTLSTEGLTSGHYAVISADVYDATGSVIMRGETPALLSNEGFTREVPLLVGRVGEFARPTTQIAGDWPSPKTVLIDGRYVLLVGEGDEQEGGLAELFDLVSLSPISWKGRLPIVPSAVMTSDGANALLLSDKGALAYNFLAGTSSAVAMSAEDAAALAGGESILSDAETAEAFVVGSTRAGGPTDAVLRVSTEGLTIIRLKTPRERASAIWVKGRGLVIVGGAEGAPVEILAAKGTSFKALQVQPPTMFEASVVTTPSSDLLVVGGLDAAGAAVPPQRLSLSCTEACIPTPEGLTLPVLRGGRPFDIGQDNARLVIGADAEGFVSAQLVDTSTMPAKATAVTTRVQRKGASSIAVGGGYVAIVGGTDAAGALVKDVELFTPPPF